MTQRASVKDMPFLTKTFNGAFIQFKKASIELEGTDINTESFTVKLLVRVYVDSTKEVLLWDKSYVFTSLSESDLTISNLYQLLKTNHFQGATDYE